eukprot:5558088-Prymnesium_polylepis.1
MEAALATSREALAQTAVGLRWQAHPSRKYVAGGAEYRNARLAHALRTALQARSAQRTAGDVLQVTFTLDELRALGVRPGALR